jgi:hypothetical protein
MWPGCPQKARHLVYCFQHWPALGEELQARLRQAQGTTDWVPALNACQDHARQTVDWVKHNVHGGRKC